MIEHPETANKPLISVAVQSVLISQMQDELKFGVQHYENGTDAKLAEQMDVFADLAARAAAEGVLTWTHLVLCQTYQALSREDPGELYLALSYLARTAIQWMEHLNEKHGGMDE